MNEHEEYLESLKGVCSQQLSIREKALLERIYASEAFHKAPRARQLLETFVKNFEVGIDKIPNRELDGYFEDRPDRSDATGRRAVGRLRELLSAYFQNEGRAEPVWIEVPKGMYGVRFFLNPVGPRSLFERFWWPHFDPNMENMFWLPQWPPVAGLPSFQNLSEGFATTSAHAFHSYLYTLDSSFLRAFYELLRNFEERNIAAEFDILGHLNTDDETRHIVLLGHPSAYPQRYQNISRFYQHWIPEDYKEAVKPISVDSARKTQVLLTDPQPGEPSVYQDSVLRVPEGWAITTYVVVVRTARFASAITAIAGHIGLALLAVTKFITKESPIKKLFNTLNLRQADSLPPSFELLFRVSIVADKARHCTLKSITPIGFRIVENLEIDAAEQDWDNWYAQQETDEYGIPLKLKHRDAASYVDYLEEANKAAKEELPEDELPEDPDVT